MENTKAEPSARFEIDLSAGGIGQEFLILGWSQQEPQFTWTMATESTLCFTPKAGTLLHGNYTLRLSGFPHVREALPLQRIDVVVNEQKIVTLIARAKFDHELVVPADVIERAPQVSIRLGFPDAQLPSSLDPQSTDHRKLAIAFTRISLQPLPTSQEPDQVSTASDKEILMDLQSLGVNCELGFVQRAVAAEPYGLFRWNSITLPDLIRALEHRFAGLGTPENTEAYVDGASEIMILDKKYNFRNHSHAFANKGAKIDAIYKRETVRIPQLVRMLLEDLEDASRLFVYHDAGASSSSEVKQLVKALMRYGSNTLLWIAPATDPSKVGKVEWVEPNFLVGFMDNFQPLRNVTPDGVSLPTWLSIAREAHKMWRSAQSQSNQRI